MTNEYREQLEEIAKKYHSDQYEKLMPAVEEYVSCRMVKIMSGSSYSASMFKEYWGNYPSEIAHNAMEVVLMAEEEGG